MNRNQEIAANLKDVKAKIQAINSQAQLIVVTKTFPISDLEILYELGERNFGENRDQEASEKAAQLPKDVIWHFQGQIQTNKIKSISNWADVIHSIDDERQIQKFAQSKKSHSVFLQVNIDNQFDEKRGGVAANMLSQLAKSVQSTSNLKLMGLMAVAPLGEDANSAFARLAKIQEQFVKDFPNAKFLSAGMSLDFEAALKHGATHVRIGSSILGNRA